MQGVISGLSVFIETPPTWIQDRRIGLLCNPASIDANYRHARHLIDARFPDQLKALFFPQHGLF